MTMYILIAFLSPLLHALSCIIDAHFSNDVFKKTSTLIFYANISNIIIIPFLFIFGTPSVPSFAVFVILFIVAFIDVFYQLPYYMALRNIDTSIIVALFSLGKITVPVLAFFIVGEKLSLVQYSGFGLILLSSFVLNFDIKKFKLNIAFFLMLLVSIVLSLSSVLQKYTLFDIDFVTLIFWMTILSSIINLSFLVFPISRHDIIAAFPKYVGRFRLFIANELLSQGGSLAIIVALSHLPVLVTQSISASQSIFTLLFGVALYKLFGHRFKENLNPQEVTKKLISFGVIIIGICLVLI